MYMEAEAEAEAFVFYSAPGMGHIFSMAELAKLIRRHALLRHPERRLSFTLIYGTVPFEPSTTNAALSHFISSNPSISFLHLPHRPIDTSPTRSRPAIAFQSLRNSAPDLSAALRRISATGTMIRALIIDMFCSTALPLASEQGIPVYYFFTSGAAALAAYLHMPAIHRKAQGRVFKDSPDLLIEIPGLPAIPATEMPEPLLDSRDPAYAEMLYFCESFLKSKGILVNTFDELEPVAMAAIAGGACVPDGPTPPVYNVGPLILDSQDAHKSSSRHETLSWLDSQPSGSVVFLCFGSRGRFTKAQTKAIAEGLERSGLRFMWVVKEEDDLAEEGFLRKITKVGLGVVIKGWAPQVAILSHESVGAFVTHCGWNSILEAVIAGKPMLAWPLYAEQHLNRAALVTTMGMAAPVVQKQHRGDFFVSGDELASSLTQLVTASPAIKEKAAAMRAKALAASLQPGSSMLALEMLLNLWMK
ncbi:hypothetical protein V2J09_024373 [Rumex salicifolius]